MIKGIGTDLVSVKRIENSLDRHGERFAKKILGPQEILDFPASKRKTNFLAKRFAAKEAVAKALGTGFANGIRWQDIQLDHLATGQPVIMLSNQALDRFNSLAAKQIMISLSDEEDLVIAYVIIQ